MRNTRMLITTIGLTVALCSCAHQQTGPGKYGFMPLKFPSNLYSPGQIVEIYSRPEKVEILYTPAIYSPRISPGWNTNDDDQANATATTKTQVTAAVKLNASAGVTDSLTVDLSHTTVKTYDEFMILAELQADIKGNPTLETMLRDRLKRCIKISVITETLEAVIDVKAKDDVNGSLDLTADNLKALSEQFGLTLKNSRTSHGYSSDPLVVGYYYDPLLIEQVLAPIDKPSCHSWH